MALTPGTRLGPYEILSALGAGGMGEVYRARDTNLKRDVAIKVLPDLVATDAERLARLTREAQTLASLNHPNIAHVHGLEEFSGVRALVMELVAGEDLSQRIVRGAIPLEEALPIAKQIAEALEAAHEQGIIHRDLKPANIKVRPDGTVKVLDFGLAKAMEPVKAPDVSQSPTITTPAMMTGVGVILGTAAYMSPEQARGKTVDKRADIWAFGAVLFEMLTGKRAFDGEDVGDTFATVLRVEPDWSALPAEAAFPVRTLLRGCLEKNPRQRIADISAALFVLRHQAAGAAMAGPASAFAATTAEKKAAHRVRGEVRRVAFFATAALILGAAVAGTGVWWLTRPAPPSIVRTTITTSGSTVLMPSGFERNVAITPDGTRVIYRGNDQLLVRDLGRLEPTVLAGLGAPRSIFISPDGQWVGFFDGFSELRKVAITGGPPVTLCAIHGVPGGASWSADGTIIFATELPGMGLQRLAATGGELTVLTRPDHVRGEGFHLWPEFLPGGTAVLYTILPDDGTIDSAQVAVLDLRTGKSKILIRGGSHGQYISTRHLLYVLNGTLRAVAFDLAGLEVIGTPAPVLDGVLTSLLGAADVAVAANGSLVYIPGGTSDGGRRTVVSVDRQGRASPLPGLVPNAYRSLRMSPDGTRLALATPDDVWIYGFARATLRRLTTHPAADRYPLWTPDGQRIVFTSTRAGYPELFWRPADGTGTDERLLTRAKDLVDLLPDGWAANGRQLLFTEVPTTIQAAIGQIAIDRPSDATMLVRNEYTNSYPAVSPDGRWMAYTQAMSGRGEIFFESYPELGARQQVSIDGGELPIWSRDGRQLFFMTPDGGKLYGVTVQPGTSLVVGPPQVLFEFQAILPSHGSRGYDIGPDGRFLIIRRDQTDAVGGQTSTLILVQNWFKELKRLVPVN